MLPEWKTKWLAALRSGEYAQGRSALRVNDTFCCLGVLCDVVHKETGLGEWTQREFLLDPDTKVFAVEDSRELHYLPMKVQEVTELFMSNPFFTMDGTPDHLSHMNDQGKTFEEIANVIEEHF